MVQTSLTQQVEQIWQEYPLGLQKDLYSRRNTPLARDVLKASALHFRYPVEYILDDRRQVGIVYARHIAMYVAYSMTNNSTPMIGRIFGDRNHTTVLHAVKKIERWIAEGKQGVIDDVEEIKRRVTKKHAPVESEHAPVSAPENT